MRNGISSFLIVMDLGVSFLGYDTKSDRQAVKIRKKRMDDCIARVNYSFNIFKMLFILKYIKIIFFYFKKLILISTY